MGTSCTPSSLVSRNPRSPSLRSAASKSSGHAGQLCSRGAHTLLCTPSQCLLDPPVARVVSLLKPWLLSRSATLCPMSSRSVVLLPRVQDRSCQVHDGEGRVRGG